MNTKELITFLNHLYHISFHEAGKGEILDNYTRTVQKLAKLQYIINEKLEVLEE